MKNYFPILKTTDAELKAYEMLADDVKTHIIPVFELTKSRKTKLAPNGDILKKMDQIVNLMEGEEFVLDLTSHDGMINYQIEDLLDSSNGFQNWVDFLLEHKVDGLIPSVHLDINDISQSVLLAEKLFNNFEKLSVRFEIGAIDGEYLESGDIRYCLDALSAIEGDLEKFIVILDAGFIKQNSRNDYNSSVVLEYVEDALKLLQSDYSPGVTVVATSSFPKSLPSHTPDCGDAYGYFLALEEGVFSQFSEYEISHGDYASIHPVRYETGGGGWVPRVDVYCGDEHFFYHRIRREAGGFEEAARRAKDDPKYERLRCWGHHEIVASAIGIPSGKSPSFWIAVRANIYMTRIVNKHFIL